MSASLLLMPVPLGGPTGGGPHWWHKLHKPAVQAGRRRLPWRSRGPPPPDAATRSARMDAVAAEPSPTPAVTHNTPPWAGRCSSRWHPQQRQAAPQTARPSAAATQQLSPRGRRACLLLLPHSWPGLTGGCCYSCSREPGQQREWAGVWGSASQTPAWSERGGGGLTWANVRRTHLLVVVLVLVLLLLLLLPAATPPPHRPEEGAWHSCIVPLLDARP